MGEILSILKNDKKLVENFNYGDYFKRLNEKREKAKRKKDNANTKRNIANQLKQAVSAAEDAEESAEQARNAEKEAEDAEKAAKEAEEEAALLEKELKELEIQIEETQDEVEDTQNQIEGTQNQIEETKGEIEDTQDEIEGAVTKAQVSEANAKDSAKEVEQARNAAANLVKETLQASSNSQVVVMNGAVENFTNIKEGFDEDESVYDPLTWLKDLLEDNEDKKNVQKAIYRRKLAQSSEILAQDDNILSNILFDYMVENEEGSNIEKVYKKLDAENKNKMRKIQINTYYTKAYKEYIYLLKITILLIAILIPILILNRIELLGKNYTLILIVSILLLGFLYIFYRLYILYMRDDINFDKFRVPYDRQAHKMYEEGTLSKKDSPLKGLGVTCIGDECCDASMIYDNLANKCVMQENFGNYFEKMNNMNNNSNINVVKQFDNFDNYRENFITSNNALKEKKNDLLAESLTNTTSTTFDKPNTRII
jgi:chemotaxis protein histidine kinase CheA